MKVLLHTTDVVTSRVVEILRKAKEISGVQETFDFAPLEDDYIPPRGAVVLSLGTYKRRGQERVVQTYSVKQLMVKGDAISRLVTAYKLLESVPKLPEFEYKVVLTLDDLRPLRKFLFGKEVAVDIETKGQVDKQVPAWEQIIALSFYEGTKAFVITEQLVQDYAAREVLDDILSTTHNILHNGKFDGKYLEICPDDDTMLMHYALHPAASDHGLKALAKEYFGAEDWDSGNKSYTKKKTYKVYTELEDGAYAQAMAYDGGSGYERIPRTMLYEYAGKDVYWTYWLWKVLSTELAGMEVHPYEHLMKLSNIFQRIESVGVRYDVDYMEQLQAELTTKGSQLETTLQELVGFPLNPRSPKQLKDYYASQGRVLASTDAETLAALAKEGDSVARLITQLRDVNKKNGTYITGYLDKLIEDRGYPTFKLHASITGRIGGGGTSLLTIPRDKSIKRMVLPDEGQVMVGADLSQAELRVMALESQDPWLIEAFQPEAGDFFDILLTQALPEHDWFELHKDEGAFYTEWRTKMKSVVYGASFSRGVRAIALELGIPESESQMLMDAFIRPGSEFDLWRKGIESLVLSGEPLYNRYGRRFQAELITSSNQANVLRSALSFTSQSTANDLLLDAALHVEERLQSFPEARIVSTLHDALYISTDSKYAEEISEMLVAEMQEAGIRQYGTQVLFKADAKIGNNLSEV